jgi:hypothetical protein
MNVKTQIMELDVSHILQRKANDEHIFLLTKLSGNAFRLH